MGDRIAAATTLIELNTGLTEKARLAEVRALGSVPVEVGPEVIEAPARGPVVAFDFQKVYPKADGKFTAKPAGFLGRKSLRLADSFDVMAAKAARHKRPSPFSPAQVAMGRFYRDLVERHESAGVRCSSLESLSQRCSGGNGDFLTAVLKDRQEIDDLRDCIGTGSAMVVRRIRPSARGSRATIMDRRLVDIVCLEDGTISDVLRSHGWSIKSDLVKALSAALGRVLDRMMAAKQVARKKALDR